MTAEDETEVWRYSTTLRDDDYLGEEWDELQQQLNDALRWAEVDAGLPCEAEIRVEVTPKDV
jgi:hypothetical protein